MTNKDKQTFRRETLAVERPDLLQEWDFEKNNALEVYPDKILAGSNKKAWWLCSAGHSYEKPIYKRALYGVSCPFCNGRKVLSGFNDLLTLRPDLGEEWDYKRNINLDPSSIALHSNKRVWWKCRICGYEWQAQPNHRANGERCPKCSAAKRIETFKENWLKPGVNDLKTIRPDIADEWNYEKNGNLRPESVTFGSKNKVWWRCKTCGNVWSATIGNRVGNGSGCPKCSKHMRTSFPEQAILYYVQMLYPDAVNSYTDIFGATLRELDIYIPSIRVGIEYDGSVWHRDDRSVQVAKEKYDICRKNGIRLIRVAESGTEHREFCDDFVLRKGISDTDLDEAIRSTLKLISTTDLDIDSSRDRNEIYRRYITSIKSRSISIKYPKSVKEWDIEKNDGITADMVSANSIISYWWKCERGHSYRMKPANKLRNGFGCPFCSNHRILSGFNDLKTRFPNLAKEWDEEKNGSVSPSQVMPGSNIKYYWVCPNGHSYLATPNSRTSKNAGCPYCSNHAVLSGFNDLATTNPGILKRWDYEKNGVLGLEPTHVLAGSVQLAWWKCEKGHSWKKTINIQVHYDYCPVCTGRIVVSGVNDIATTHPKLAEEWDYERNGELMPQSVTFVCDKKVWWRCTTCGFEWKSKVNMRAQKDTICPKCGYATKMKATLKKNIAMSKNNLASRFPEIADEWDYERNEGLDPTTVSWGANKKVWWVCPNGHHYQAWIGDRTGSHKSGCPFCSGKRIVGSLVETNPDLIKEWDYEKNKPHKPEEYQRSSKETVWWLCEKHHSYSARIVNRANPDHGTGCPYCANKKVLTGYNDLETLYPAIAKEWNTEKNGDLKPSDIIGGSSKKVWWKCCVCGFEWQNTIIQRTFASVGCPQCRNKKRSKKVICVETGRVFDSVKEAAEWAEVTPSSVTICLKGRIKTCGGYHWKYFE